MADKEHDLPLREKDESALTDPSLVSSVAASLAEIGGDLADEELAADPTPDDQDVDDDPADDVSDDDPTPEDNDDDDECGEEGDTLTEIPSAYMRSAAHFGWDEKAVADMVDMAGADHVVNLLRDLHAKDNNLTSKFADIGRQSKAEPGKLNTPAPDVSRTSDAPAKNKIDIAALREKYGDDDPLVDIIAIQQENVDRLDKKLDGVSSKLSDTRNTLTQQEFKRQQEDRKLLDKFFGGDDLDPYKDFYGKLADGAETWSDLSSQQQVNRHQVCMLADDIMRGAGIRGADMDPGEALARAHAVVSGPITESVTRRKIMSEVEKRSNAKVVRPSKGKATSKPGVAGKSKTKEEVIARANERLASVFK